MDNRQLVPSNDEIIAVALANQCKTFIARIRKVKNQQNAEALRIEYFQLKASIIELLNQMNAPVNVGAHAAVAAVPGPHEIKSYYFLYLLQQVSRFNQFVNQSIVSITDNRKLPAESAPVKLNEDWPGFVELNKMGITAILHPLLNQATNVSLKITINNENKFRDAYQLDDDGTRYYYHPKQTKDGHAHQDREHYKKANPNIAIPTQLSNVFGFLTPKLGQRSNRYFKLADDQAHQREKTLFESAIVNIQTAKPLSEEQQQVLSAGKYYRYSSPVKFGVAAKKTNRSDHQITHIGHASEFIAMQNEVPLHVCIDPLHYQSGTGGVIGVGAKVLYDRQTAPAFATDAYPAVNVVIISHNHYDHMCKQSLTEAFSHSNTLFIVPVGDAKHLQSFGFTNVIEMGSWNDVVTISVSDDAGKNSVYEIHGLPANHASNRSTTDYFASLYMGYMLRDVSKNEIILCTGDTAVLDEEHFVQLEKYLLENNLTIKTACIAHGPDRPRQWMKCTHQSTADALTMQARFAVMNAKVLAKRKATELRVLSFEQVKESACYAIGYHQGCYRLGVLSYNDVDTTILRTLAVLASFKDAPIAVVKAQLANNIFYAFMDDFEQVALQATLDVYLQLNTNLTANKVLELISSHLHIPQPGYRADFSQQKPYAGFEFDYERLMVNRNPNLAKDSPKELEGALDYFCRHLGPSFYAGIFDKVKLAEEVMRIYFERKKTPVPLVKAFLNEIREGSVTVDNVEARLAKLYVELHPKQDEGKRDEGHSHTALSMIAGLFHFKGFRDQVRSRFNELQVVDRSESSAGYMVK